MATLFVAFQSSHVLTVIVEESFMKANLSMSVQDENKNYTV